MIRLNSCFETWFGGLEHVFYLSIQLRRIIQTDELIFVQRGRYTSSQIAVDYDLGKMIGDTMPNFLSMRDIDHQNMVAL